ncbi:MAG TPA: 16S rRNA (cytidine(1402)-2'-O)-methyltransferase [Steroidobacteraceae bacterium]|nr:16S rRNA (cytidine(1402)-2'-O)-methyltransferase [Steroidobacteraceae bacterium]
MTAASAARPTVHRTCMVEKPLCQSQAWGRQRQRHERRIIVSKPRGRLQVVATPIGNMGDVSARARQALESAAAVAAEDTRHTGALLQALGIARPLLSLHAHNETQRVPEVLARLAAGETIALVSDAGTPLLSDPGYELVRAAADAGFEIEAVPGPSAITSALAVAGLPVSRFCFEGFLPARDRERRTQLAALADEPRTLVFFEAPHRIAAALADLAAEFGGDRRAAVARELTKAHETIYRGTLAELAQRAATEDNFRRGEITIVVAGAAREAAGVDNALLRRAVDLLSKELSPSRAAAIAAQLTGATRAEAYALIQQRNPSPAPESD